MKTRAARSQCRSKVFTEYFLYYFGHNVGRLLFKYGSASGFADALLLLLGLKSVDLHLALETKLVTTDVSSQISVVVEVGPVDFGQGLQL